MGLLRTPMVGIVLVVQCCKLVAKWSNFGNWQIDLATDNFLLATREVFS